MNHQNYWLKKETAKKYAYEHTKLMEEEPFYLEATKASCSNTKRYLESDVFSIKHDELCPDVIIESLDSVSAVLKYADKGNKVCVLNFASYKEPGGMFTKGSLAQEECLCRESNLFNILFRFKNSYYNNNQKALNKGLYLNRALYVPDVLFIRDNKMVHCDVVTCAAPNYNVAHKYQNVSKLENHEVLKSRIKYILDIMASNDVDVPILGAFGCGVFGQDTKEVAEVFKEIIELEKYKFKKVVFAIIEGPNLYDFKDVYQ